SVSLRERVIWGSHCEGPAGTGLSFGGQDQSGPEGRAGTSGLQDGNWTEIGAELRQKNALAKPHGQLVKRAADQAHLLAKARPLYFRGLPEAERKAASQNELLREQLHVAQELVALTIDLRQLTALTSLD